MSAYFFDSSALVKRYVSEAGTPWVIGVTDPAAGARVYVAAIVLANAKGRTGKTTVAVNLSACLALHHGKRVLGIDLDPQGNFGISYGIDPRQLTLTSYHLLTSEAPQARDYVVEVKPNLHLIPNAIAPDLENRLEGSHNRDSLLRLRLRQLKGQYDYVLIDTPPAMRTATMNAIVAADEVIVVVVR